jgi:glucose/arabinose dehydrogenase
MKYYLLSILVLVSLASTYFWFYSSNETEILPIVLPDSQTLDTQGTSTIVIPPPTVTDYRALPTREASLTAVASGLDAPWGFDWLPNGDVLVTERFGDLRLVRNGEMQGAISGVPAVLASGQGGLLDVTTHPNFSENQYVYLSYAHGTEEGNRLRVARGELREQALENVAVIFEVAETKSGSQHFGSRFQWLPDGTLLVSVGDGGNPPTEYNGDLIREQAQSLSTHFGKVIRINDDGSIPDDNPFLGRPDVRPEIFSYGHRNIQGITYDTTRERIIASEHGSKGGDELNEVRAGANYGWPRTTYATEYDAFSTEISPDQVLPGIENPLAVWTPTIAPSEVVYYDGIQYGDQYSGSLFLAAMLLRASDSIASYVFSPAGAIIRLETDEAGLPTAQERINVGEVRVRSIEEGPDGYLYVLTDDTGRQSRPGKSGGALWRVESF